MALLPLLSIWGRFHKELGLVLGDINVWLVLG